MIRPWFLQCLLHGWMVTVALSAEFPEPFSSEKRGDPVSPSQAATSFKLPPGFKVSVFAAEPDVRQPIAMTFDPRGRLWVAENYTYAEAGVNFATNLNDRVVVFEDEDNDGHFDRRTVFWDQAKILTSVEVGLGGVFVLCPPKLLFIHDRNGDDVPDREPEVLLDGFSTTTGNRHTFANGLKWGPDGWLWGRIGISSGARIGVPGAPDSERVEMRGGVWRFHPIRRVFEAVSHGTTNPWGLDWDENGEPFFINTVIGHLWHAIPGAHFQRMHGDDVDPHAYELIGQHADHYHFDTGAGWQKSRAAMDGTSFASGSDELGGGHAHCGLLIYQGENWPTEYRDKLFTINLHGRRINTERLERHGSGYVGRHEHDLLSIGDPWFRGLELIQGPDGGVFLSDWSDTGECHDHDGVHRTSGRIYKITYGDPKPPKVTDLTRVSASELQKLLTDSDAWVSRQARRVMLDRRQASLTNYPSSVQLKDDFEQTKDSLVRLRLMWAINAAGVADTDWLRKRLTGSSRDTNEHVRSWAVRLLADALVTDARSKIIPSVSARRRAAAERSYAETTQAFIELARTDSSPLVLLYLASALQKLPADERGPLASALSARPEIRDDHNLPLLLWTGIEPLLTARPGAAAPLAKEVASPLLRRFIARRLAEDLEGKPTAVGDLLAAAVAWPGAAQADLVHGLNEGLRGWRKAVAPASWKGFSEAVGGSADADTQNELRGLHLLFGDGRALDDLRAILADGKADVVARRNALRALLESRSEGIAPLLRKAADDGALRVAALVGLLQLGEADSPSFALARYQWLGLEERPAVLGAMVTRPAAAKALLEAIAEGRVARAELTAFQARQMAGLGDATLTKRLGEVWGTVKAGGEDHSAEAAKLRELLMPTQLQAANLPHGRQVFTLVCAPCHQLYGEGGQVGPDLTGSGRSSLDYLLENVLSPSAVVPADYRMTVATLKDGSVLNGVVREQTARTITLQSQTERRVLERSDVQMLEQSDQSMMPEGLVATMPPHDVRDLFAYLMHPRQVPLPK